MSERALKIFQDRKFSNQLTPEVIRYPLEKVKAFSLPLLRNGRPKYDVLHSFHVDYFVSRIARAEGFDELVLRTCAWLHDVGNYIDRKNHEKHSLQKANKFFVLNEHFYTVEQIERILRIIEIHDTTRFIEEPDEIAFMEADVLGAITTDTVKFEGCREAVLYTENNLLPKIAKFKTGEGKRLLGKYVTDFVKDIYVLP